MKRKSTKSNSWLGKVHQKIDQQLWLQSGLLLGIRLYLIPIFLLPGWQQFNNFEATVIFLGDQVALPLPFLMAILVIGIQLLGSLSLLLGLFTRWSAFALMLVMLIIVLLVQSENGWHYIIEYNASIEQMINLIQQYGNYDQLTQQGEIALISNGIEISIMYMLLLLTLFSFGGGKLSLDTRL